MLYPIMVYLLLKKWYIGTNIIVIYIHIYIIGILDNLGIGLLYIGDIVYTIIGIIYIYYILDIGII